MPDGLSWEYENPVRIIFGWGRLQELGALAGRRPLVVTTGGATRRGLTTRVTALLADRTCRVIDTVEPNPALPEIERAAAATQGAVIDTIVAIGGGSTLDFAKALSVALAGGAPPLRDALVDPTLLAGMRAVDVVAVPTTAGTGSEVTPFAAVWDKDTHRKHSLSGACLFPRVALLDPALTVTLPWEATLAPGLDAFVQCFEALWSRRATPVTTALAERGLRGVPRALRRLQADLHDPESRSAMLEASLLSGLAISHTRTALAHSLGYPLTAHFGLPHGLACAAALPSVLRFNLGADDGRFAAVAAGLGLGAAGELPDWILRLFGDLDVAAAIRRHLPSWREVERLAPEMLAPGRADNNLRAADIEAVRAILADARGWLGME